MIIPVVDLDLMAKKQPPVTPPPAAEPDQPSSETVRVAGDLMEMLRLICFHTRDERNRRLKLTQYVDGLLRPLVVREHAALRARLEEES